MGGKWDKCVHLIQCHPFFFIHEEHQWHDIKTMILIVRFWGQHRWIEQLKKKKIKKDEKVAKCWKLGSEC